MKKPHRRAQDRRDETPVLLPQGTRVDRASLSQQPWTAAHSVGHWGSSLQPRCPGCLLGPGQVSMTDHLCAWPQSQLLQVSRPPLWAQTTWCDPRPPSKQDPLTWQEIPSLRGYLPAAPESRAFLWARLTLSWKILFLSRASSVWEQKYNKLSNITLFGHMPCTGKKMLALRTLPQTPAGRGPINSSVELKGPWS